MDDLRASSTRQHQYGGIIKFLDRPKDFISTKCSPRNGPNPSRYACHAPLLRRISTKRCSTLQNKLSAVEQSNRNVADELQTIQRNTGAAFPLFRRLPIELRTMIWQCALTSTPQIHILGDTLVSRSYINGVAESCKEAWDLFKQLRLDYLLVETYSGLLRKNYINFDLDTF